MPLRFHSPLVKPDVRIARIRLSDKGLLCFRPRQAGSQSFQTQEPEPLVEMLNGKRFASRPLDLMLIAQPSTEPIPRVAMEKFATADGRLRFATTEAFLQRFGLTSLGELTSAGVPGCGRRSTSRAP